ncbi:hypothetical protein D9M71_551450 [compost metagenome]
MGLVPGLRIGQGQQRQARCTPHTVGAGERGAEQAQADAAEQPQRAQAQLPGHLHAVQAAQAGGDIRQQDAGQQVTADYTGQTADQGQSAEFDGQADDQHPRADPAGAQGPQQTTPLFQRQPYRGMHDKQADHERQEPQGVQVQVKALGQARQVVFFAAGLELQLSLERIGQRRAEIPGQ